MEDFDNSPYSLMFLNNAIQNEETTADHRSGTIFPSITIHEHILIQAKGDINRNWVLIDNQSTVHVIYNLKLLNNIRRTDRTIHIFCNAGVKTTDMVGDTPGMGEVWYHSEGIANILSKALIHKDYQVKYNSRLDNTSRV